MVKVYSTYVKSKKALKKSFFLLVPIESIMITTYVCSLNLRVDTSLYTVFIILFKIS